MWPPLRVKITSTPNPFSAATACSPACPFMPAVCPTRAGSTSEAALCAICRISMRNAASDGTPAGGSITAGSAGCAQLSRLGPSAIDVENVDLRLQVDLLGTGWVVVVAGAPHGQHLLCLARLNREPVRANSRDFVVEARVS